MKETAAQKVQTSSYITQPIFFKTFQTLGEFLASGRKAEQVNISLSLHVVLWMVS